METINYKGYDINILPDHMPESPREWYNLSTLVLFHNRYSLPNELNIDPNDFEGWEEMEAFIKREYNPAIIRRVSMYDHSGISLSMSAPTCPWDSGYVGFILITKEDIREHYNIKRITSKYIEKVYERMKGELETYNDYLNGSVYGYSIQADGFEDALFGFYGYDHEESGLLDNARNEIDHHLKEKAYKRYSRVKEFIRNNVPFHVRQTQLT